MNEVQRAKIVLKILNKITAPLLTHKDPEDHPKTQAEQIKTNSNKISYKCAIPFGLAFIFFL